MALAGEDDDGEVGLGVALAGAPDRHELAGWGGRSCGRAGVGAELVHDGTVGEEAAPGPALYCRSMCIISTAAQVPARGKCSSNASTPPAPAATSSASSVRPA